MKTFSFVWIALLSSALSLPAEETNLQIYKVHYADPAELAVVIPMMMPSTNGLVLETVDKTLLVRGTAAQHEVVRQMLRDLDAPPKNIQINVEFETSGESHNREFGVRLAGPVVVYDGDVHGSLQGRFSSRSTTSSENTTQMLVASDGRSASLRVGETVPYIAWLTEYGYRHGYVRYIQIEWREVGSFLAVEPTIVSPGIIRVRLTPELSGRLENGERQSIQFTHLATEVIVGDGQTISIGGFSTDEDFSSKFLIGRGARGESSVTGITLTPRILD
ncbi:MAG: hypothetical protein JEZ10_05825 [Verrucomicrobia bacterium]|nr:hypothetical protein [Verrucomicrobiota bacterium]